MIQEVAQAFEGLDQEVVFVGGATVALYLDLSTAEEIRPTEDVDVVIQIASAMDYSKFSEKLLKLKFNPDILFSVDSPDFTLRVAEKVNFRWGHWLRYAKETIISC
jgi:lipid A disaccharide synthetase